MSRLVVYYSYTGNTKKVVSMIQQRISCDVLEIQPAHPFSQNYQEVVDEYQNNSIDNKEVEIEPIHFNLEKYDEIIIGTPVWWYTISPPIITFLKKYDLTGKTIYPFATNAGWLGHSFADLEKLCPNSKVAPGMNIVFDANTRDKCITSEEKINNWIDHLSKKEEKTK